MTTRGIFNPHKPEAPPPEEKETVPYTGFIDLDGDSYVLRFHGVKHIKDVVPVLLDCIYAVNDTNEKHLRANGVYIGTPTFDTSLPHMSLRHEAKKLHVYTTEKHEIDIYRRLGMTLFTLPDKTPLKKYGVQIIQRG